MKIPFAAVAALLALAAAPVVEARSFRPFWIPAANAPEAGICRFEAEDLFPMQRRDSDRAGEFYSYSIGAGCNAYSWRGFDFEAGLDWRESDDVRATDFFDPFQGYARVTYGQKDAQRDQDGWTAALGIDDVGFQKGRTDFDVAYAALENRSGPLELEIGGYSGNGDTLKTAAGDADPNGVMLAVRDYVGRGELGIEWRSGRNRDGYGFVGGRIQFDETLAAAVGYAIANDRENMRDWLLVRLTMQQ